jgi:hypothetical protein
LKDFRLRFGGLFLRVGGHDGALRLQRELLDFLFQRLIAAFALASFASTSLERLALFQLGDALVHSSLAVDFCAFAYSSHLSDSSLISMVVPFGNEKAARRRLVCG